MGVASKKYLFLFGCKVNRKIVKLKAKTIKISRKLEKISKTFS